MNQKSKKQLKEFLSWLTIFLTLLWVFLFLYGVLVEQKINISLEKANGQIKTIEVTKSEGSPETKTEEPKRRLHDAVETQENKEIEPAKPEGQEHKTQEEQPVPTQNPAPPSNENLEEKPAEPQPNLDKIEKDVTVDFREASLSDATQRVG